MTIGTVQSHAVQALVALAANRTHLVTMLNTVSKSRDTQASVRQQATEALKDLKGPYAWMNLAQIKRAIHG